MLFGGGSKATQAPVAVGGLNIQQSSYGTPIPIVGGTNRLSGNLLFYGDFNSWLVSTGGGGGKGGIVGGGGKGGGSSEYNYSATFQIGICEGPITGIGTVWVSKQITDMPTLGGVVQTGTLDQAPWGYMTTYHPAQALGYNGMATANFSNFALGTSSETPQFSFKVSGILVGPGGDCYADQWIADFLSRSAFPSANIASFSDAANYWIAMGFFISPIVDTQQTAAQWMKQWMDTLNAEYCWIGNQLHIFPYADSVVSGNGVTYTPNLTPQYDLGPDDFQGDGSTDPVTATRPDLGAAYNQYPIEYINRNDQYNIETLTVEDPGMIDNFSARTATTLSAHHVTDQTMAQSMAALYMKRQIYVEHGPIYTFKLSWKYFLLDVMDYVTLTEPALDLNRTLVRIRTIDEDKDGNLTFTAECMPGSIALPALHPPQQTIRNVPNYNASPGSINIPIIFETPLALLQAPKTEIAIAISGQGTLWGGCDVWCSTDDVTYTYVAQINGQARQGVLSAALPNFIPQSGANNIDPGSILSIDMTESRGVLNNAANQQDAVQFNTLCYVDSEFIAYGNDVLTGTNTYNLTYLNRGCYGTTIGAHASGSQFCRFDDSIARYDVDQTRIGQTLYFKFVSFNVWGGAIETLADVPAYPHKVGGIALLTPLVAPYNLSVSYQDNIATLNWTGISDIRYPIFYEIRKGTIFISAQIIAETSGGSFNVYGSDTYWVTALYYTPLGVAVYSDSPPSIVVITPALQQNIIETHEESPNWTGTFGGGASKVGSTVELGSTIGNILTEPNVLTVPNVLNYPTPSTSGSYTAPTGNRIVLAAVANSKVIMNWTLTAVSNLSDVTTMPDITQVTDMTGIVSSGLVYGIPQIRLSQDYGTTWGDWQNWVPGVYTFNAIDYQILLYSYDDTVTPIMSQFSITVDVPQLIQTGDQATVGTGTSAITFANQFNQTPIINATILDAVAGDIVVVNSPTVSGFNLGVTNAGVYVVRSVHWSAVAW
jgi:hypothetical protein